MFADSHLVEDLRGQYTQIRWRVEAWIKKSRG
jgi:hypothetical protein